MWNRIRYFVLVYASFGLLAGCAITTAIPVDPNDRTTWGFRVYESKPLLVVAKDSYKIVFVPNYSKAYAVRFDAFLAKNKSKVPVASGMIEGTIDADLDSTAIISLLQDIAKQVAPGKGADVDGTKALVAIYEFVFDDQGNLLGLRRLPTNSPHGKQFG